MNRLNILLDEFRAAMLEKFYRRRSRAIARWGSSVTEDSFDWDALSLPHIEEHLREEIQEWLAPDADRAAEDVDLANMAFLDWVARRQR